MVLIISNIMLEINNKGESYEKAIFPHLPFIGGHGCFRDQNLSIRYWRRDKDLVYIGNITHDNDSYSLYHGNNLWS